MIAAPKTGSKTPPRRSPQLPRKTLFSESVTGSLDDITKLIQSGADVNAKDKYLITPLHYAARNGHTAVATCLLTAGANPKSSDKWGQTPLQVAESRGDQATVDTLIDAEAKVDAKNEYGRTLLHRAAESGNPNALHKDIQTYINTNLQKEKTDLFDLLEQNPTDEKRTAHTKKVIALITQHTILLFAKDEDNWGDPPLHWAARNGHDEIAQALITAGAEVNARNKIGHTPLHWAVNGHEATVEVLLQAGAKVNAKTNSGSTPLHLAAKWGKTDIAKLLIANRAEVNTKDENGDTPLHLAACFNHTEIAQALQEAGATK